MKNITGLLAGIVLILTLSGCVGAVVYRRPEPPPLEVEVVPARPYSDAIWMPGYWSWYDRDRVYYWHKGYWRRHNSSGRRDRY